MLLELQHTTTWARPKDPTSPGSPPKIEPPTVHRPVEIDGTQTKRSNISASALDGVRVLDGIAPLERARLYEYKLSSRLDVLQSWEGAITAINFDCGIFVARLYPVTGNSQEIAEAEFDIDDVSENDLDLLRIGGIFRWMVGYRTQSYGQRERISAIVFRRLPGWSEEDLYAARAEGERLAASILVE